MFLPRAVLAAAVSFALAATQVRVDAEVIREPYTFSTFAGYSHGFADGTGAAARFNEVAGLGSDAAGNIYVADVYNSAVRKVTPAGLVTTVAVAPLIMPPQWPPSVFFPIDVAVDGSGNLFVTDWRHIILKVTPDGSLSTFAGQVNSTGGGYVGGYADGVGINAQFNGPAGITVDGAGNVFVADGLNRVIRKITPAGLVSTVAGKAGESGYVDGAAIDARFQLPRSVAVDAVGNVYVADTTAVRKITPGGYVSTLAGSASQSGSTDGTGSAATFEAMADIAVDKAGNVFVAQRNNLVRRVTSTGVVTTLAGQATSDPYSPLRGSVDGYGSAVRFMNVSGVAVDNAGAVYVADGSYADYLNNENNTIRKITPDGYVSTLAGAWCCWL